MRAKPGSGVEPDEPLDFNGVGRHDPDGPLDLNALRPPWEQAGVPRRDCRSHHAGWLSPLAMLSFVLGVLSLVSVLPGLCGLPLGLVVLRLARHDLVEIRGARMDPNGSPALERAMPVAAWGAALSGCGLLIGSCLGLLYLAFLLLTYGIT